MQGELVRREMPVFDRGKFAPADPEIRAGMPTGKYTKGVQGPARYRTAADRTPGRLVTAKVLGDPAPGRAGKAPDCEDSRRAEQSREAYRLLGKEPPQEGYGVMDLEAVKDRLDRLAPRRWKPPFRDAAE